MIHFRDTNLTNNALCGVIGADTSIPEQVTCSDCFAKLATVNRHPYTQAEYDAFGWSPLSRSSLPPDETYGLDYSSARETTPRWFGVSSGNGNDGVSHTFPDYYCRTNDPWTLAAAAMLGQFKPAGFDFAADAMTIDGESDYTITAMISDPPDDDDEETNKYVNHYECDCGETWDDESPYTNNDKCPACNKECEPYESDDIETESWSGVNGAWLLVDVFPVDEMPEFSLDRGELIMESDPFNKPAYMSLADCFDADLLARAESI